METSVYNNKISSIFELIGNNENALTSSLIICFHYSKKLLKEILYTLGIKNISKKKLSKIKINYQLFGKDTNEGITDIEIQFEKEFHIIIEGKIGSSYPSLKQCEKYLKRFDQTSNQNNILAVLLDSADSGIVDSYIQKNGKFKGILKCFLWSNIYKLAQIIQSKSNDSIEKTLLQQLCHFIEGGYYMKSYEEEVWIVSIDTGPEWDGEGFQDFPLKHRIYFHPSDRHRRKSIYFGARAHGKLEYVQRIKRIEYDKTLIRDFPQLSKEDWAHKPHTLFFLDDPIKLPKPIKSGNIRNRVVYSDFDILINAKTVEEAGLLTKKRREKDNS